jgi:hypothetical protein
MESDLIVESHGLTSHAFLFESEFANFSSRGSSSAENSFLDHQRAYLTILFHHAKARNCEFWLARSRSRGTILARLGADIPATRGNQGSIGFFDCESSDAGRSAALHLIRVALDWLKHGGAQTVFGPMDFNSWFQYRFKIRENGSGHDDADLPWEPSASTEHREIFAASGFSDSIHFSSFFFALERTEDWDPYLARIRGQHHDLLSTGFTIRPFRTGAELREDLVHIHSVSKKAFAQNPMYEDIPLDIFLRLTEASGNSSDTGASRLCLSPQGEAAGFLFAFVLDATMVYKTVAVIPEYQSLGISLALTYEMSLQCRKQNLLKCVGALVRSGNRSERLGQGFESFAKSSGVNNYVLMQKAII